jgi:hypothetical protein
VGAVIAAGVALGHESQPASASHTEIYFSYSSFQPAQPTNTVIVNPNGLPRDIYVWVKNVHDPSGASAFWLHTKFGASYVSVLNFIGYTTWLDDGGRSASCQPADIDDDSATMQCITVGQVPPYGAQGGGIMGRVRWLPKPTMQPSSPADFGDSYLINTPPDPDDWQYIPVSIPALTILYLQCADFNGDDVIDLANDILGVIQHYNTTPASPNWDPVYDLDDNNIIDLANDILGTILQYQLPCQQPE